MLSNLQTTLFTFFEIGIFGFKNYNNGVYHDFNKNNELYTCILHYTCMSYFGQMYPSSLYCNPYQIPVYHFPLQSLTLRNYLVLTVFKGTDPRSGAGVAWWFLSSHMRNTSISSQDLDTNCQ